MTTDKRLQRLESRRSRKRVGVGMPSFYRDLEANPGLLAAMYPKGATHAQH